MKPVIRLLPVAILLVGCERSESTGSAKPPRAIVVTESAPMDAVQANPGPAPRAIFVAEPVTEPEAEVVVIPTGDPVAREVSQARAHGAMVAGKVEESLQAAGEKTQEAAGIAGDRTREAVEVARERTETGLRQAADATGGFLKRAGEQIEEAAADAEKP